MLTFESQQSAGTAAIVEKLVASQLPSSPLSLPASFLAYLRLSLSGAHHLPTPAVFLREKENNRTNKY